MSNSYQQIYISTVNNLEKKYSNLHNLYLLKAINQKINCFRGFSSDPIGYYQCFNDVEVGMLTQSQTFVKNCELIDVDIC